MILTFFKGWEKKQALECILWAYEDIEQVNFFMMVNTMIDAQQTTWETIWVTCIVFLWKPC